MKQGGVPLPAVCSRVEAEAGAPFRLHRELLAATTDR